MKNMKYMFNIGKSWYYLLRTNSKHAETQQVLNSWHKK